MGSLDDVRRVLWSDTVGTIQAKEMNCMGRSMKVLGMCLVAVFAVCAAVASTALATQSEPYLLFSPAATELPGEAEISEGNLYVPALNMHIHCTGGSGTGTILNKTEDGQEFASIKGATVTFEGCGIPSFEECEINGKPYEEGVIEAKGIEGKLGYAPGDGGNANDVRAELLPESGSFTTIKLSNPVHGECSLENTYVVDGSLIAAVPSGDINTPLQELKLSVKVKSSNHLQELTEIEYPDISSGVVPDELAYGGHPAGIEGSITLKLAKANREAGDKVEVMVP